MHVPLKTNDTRPRYLRAAEQNLNDGYMLIWDDQEQRASWHHPYQAPLGEPWHHVAAIREAFGLVGPHAFETVNVQVSTVVQPAGEEGDEQTEARLARKKQPARSNESPPIEAKFEGEPILLRKKWYTRRELEELTGIPRDFWRPYRHYWSDWIWRKRGTHPMAPVELHVESVALELSRRRLPFQVEIDGELVDSDMRGYSPFAVKIVWPRGWFTPGDYRPNLPRASRPLMHLRDIRASLYYLQARRQNAVSEGNERLVALLTSRYNAFVRDLREEREFLLQRLADLEPILRKTEKASHQNVCEHT